MKITIETDNTTYSVSQPRDDQTWTEMLNIFVGLLKSQGYHIPEALSDASINEDWSAFEEHEDAPMKELSEATMEALDRGMRDVAEGRAYPLDLGFDEARFSMHTENIKFMASNGQEFAFETQHMVPDPNGDWIKYWGK